MPSIISEKENMMDFPRGGGSGLTNLEIREIKHEVEEELEVMQGLLMIRPLLRKRKDLVRKVKVQRN